MGTDIFLMAHVWFMFLWWVGEELVVRGLSPGKFCHMAYVGAEWARMGRRETWGPWTGSAACLCLLVGSVIPLSLSFTGYKVRKIISLCLLVVQIKWVEAL